MPAGFVDYLRTSTTRTNTTELINCRLAMLGFVAALWIEFRTGWWAVSLCA